MDLKNQNMDMEAPIMCAKGCDFFGSVTNMNMCSKCYKECLKEEQFANATANIAKLAILSEIPVNGDEVISRNSEVNSKPARNRCDSCKKRIGPLGFECRCGGVFCATHRYPEVHSCNVDFKKAGKEILAKQNPVIKADKLQWRA